MINRFRRRLSFKQRDRDAVVSHRHSIFEFEFFPQPQSVLEPLRRLFRVAHSKAKVADFSKRKWNLHWGCGVWWHYYRLERFREMSSSMNRRLKSSKA